MRRFKKAFTEVARKNAKSQEEAGIALYEIAVTATKNREVCEVYTAGVKRDQSKIVFNEADLMLRGSPLRKKFDVTKVMITHKKTGSFIKPLSKEDGKSGDGTNPAALIVDEYHQHPTTEFYDLGLGANTKEPLLMIDVYKRQSERWRRTDENNKHRKFKRRHWKNNNQCGHD